jgi:hypothetical protein
MASDSNSNFDPAGFAKMVPGFDFLQNLSKGAQTAMPQGMQSAFNQWVAPTMDPEVIEKRLEELRTVLFWLEQNTTVLKATIQALEVQKMTMSALKSMNVTPDWSTLFKPKVDAPSPYANPLSNPAKTPDRAEEPVAQTHADQTAADPMQMWGALTKQFQNIATKALQDVAHHAADVQPAQSSAKVATRSKSGNPATAKKPSAARKRFAPAMRSKS